MSGFSLLVADDHPLLAEPLSRLLALWYAMREPVFTLAGLDAALERGPPDVVLLDVGFGLERSTDRLPGLVSRYPATRFLMLTGCADAVCMRHALRCGASGWVLKGCHPAELRLAIDEVAAGRVYVTPELSRVAPEPDGEALTPMQRRVLALRREGRSVVETAAILGRTVKAVEHHVRELRRKLGVVDARIRVNWRDVGFERGVGPTATD